MVSHYLTRKRHLKCIISILFIFCLILFLNRVKVSVFIEGFTFCAVEQHQLHQTFTNIYCKLIWSKNPSKCFFFWFLLGLIPLIKTIQSRGIVFLNWGLWSIAGASVIISFCYSGGNVKLTACHYYTQRLGFRVISPLDTWIDLNRNDSCRETVSADPDNDFQ